MSVDPYIHGRGFPSLLEAQLCAMAFYTRSDRSSFSADPERSLTGSLLTRTYRRVFVQRHGIGPAKHRPLPRPSFLVDKDDLVQRSFQHPHDLGDLCPMKAKPPCALPTRNSPPLVESAIEKWTCQWYSSWCVVAHGLRSLYQVTRIMSKKLSQ